MIEGTVNENFEATIHLTLHGTAGEEHDIEAIIDTGFTGHLTLPMMLIEPTGSALAKSWSGTTGRRQLARIRRVHRDCVMERPGSRGRSGRGRH